MAATLSTTHLIITRLTGQFIAFLSNEVDATTHASRTVSRLANKANQINNNNGNNTVNDDEAMVTALSGELAQLARAVSAIDGELNAQVASNHESLLQHVSAVKELEQTLGLVTTGVDALQQSIDRIKSEITEPFRVIQQRTRQLERIHQCAELLRRLLRFVQHVRRLRAHLAKADLAHAAHSLHALNALVAADDASLRGVHVVEQHRAWLAATGDDVRERAAQLLLRGVAEQHQADTATALQVFLNLGTLQLRVAACVDGALRRVRDAVDAAFDAAALHRDAAALVERKEQADADAALRAALWLRLDAVYDALHDGVVQVHHLHSVLLRRRDPQTHRPLASSLADPLAPLTARFWRDAVALLDARVAAATGSSSEFLDAFVLDYPRALRQLYEVRRRVRGHFQAKRVRVPFGDEADDADALLAVVARYRTPYLQRSWERLYAEAQSAFGVVGGASNGDGATAAAAPSKVPSAQQILRFVKTVADELDRSAVTPDVALAVAKGVARSVKYFGSAAEAMIDVSADAQRIGAEPGKGGKRNAAVFAALQQLHSSLSLVMRSLASDASATVDVGAPLASALQVAVMQVAEQIVEPLFGKFTKLAEATILDVHRANYARADEHGDQQPECSAFVRALQGHVEAFRAQTLARFGSSELLAQRCLKLTHRLLDFFVRHACLVRPLGRGGRLQLAADMAQFEAGVAPLVLPLLNNESAVGVEALRQFGGAAYKRLRRARPALFEPPAKLVAAARDGSLTPTQVLHLLIGLAPEALVSPHRALQWTIGRYSLFLDESSDAVVWQTINEQCVRPFAAKHADDPVVQAMIEVGSLSL